MRAHIHPLCEQRPADEPLCDPEELPEDADICGVCQQKAEKLPRELVV